MYQTTETRANAGDTRDAGSIPVSARSPGAGDGSPLQRACLDNPRDGGAWWATVHRVTKSGTGKVTEQACVYQILC